MTRTTGSFYGPGHFRRIRLINGDTQKDAAKRFGISQSAVAKWESGESSIDKRHFRVLQAYAVEAAAKILEPFGGHISDR